VHNFLSFANSVAECRHLSTGDTSSVVGCLPLAVTPAAVNRQLPTVSTVNCAVTSVNAGSTKVVPPTHSSSWRLTYGFFFNGGSVVVFHGSFCVFLLVESGALQHVALEGEKGVVSMANLKFTKIRF